MSQDYRTRIEEAVMNSPIREIPLEFISTVILTMDDGTHRSLSSEDFYEMTSKYDIEDLEDLGIEGVSFQIDMDYAVDVIHKITQEILNSMCSQ